MNQIQISTIRALWRQGWTIPEIAERFMSGPREIAAIVNGRRDAVKR